MQRLLLAAALLALTACKGPQLDPPSWTLEPPTADGWYWVQWGTTDQIVATKVAGPHAVSIYAGPPMTLEQMTANQSLWWTAPIQPPE